jgi:hypothetical protein
MNESIDNKHTMKNSLLLVGLDVHAQNIPLPWPAETRRKHVRAASSLTACTPVEKVFVQSSI